MQWSAECRHGLKAHNKIDSTTDVIYLGESTTAHSRLERRGLNDLRTCTIQWLSMTFCNLCLSLQPHSHWTKGKLIRPIAWNPGNPASVLITLSIIYRLSKMTFILKHWHKKNAAESRLRASPQRLWTKRSLERGSFHISWWLMPSSEFYHFGMIQDFTSSRRSISS